MAFRAATVMERIQNRDSNGATIRILHIFGVLSRSGGAEKWILDLFDLYHKEIESGVRTPTVQFDFLLSVDDGPNVAEVRRLGSTVHFVPFSHSFLPYPSLNPYLKGVEQVLRTCSYNVVHVHQFDLAGEILRIASKLGVERRVFSLHNPRYSKDHSNVIRRFMYESYGKQALRRYVTDFFSCSDATARIYFDTKNIDDPRVRTVHYGIDPEPFRRAIQESAAEPDVHRRFRNEFNVPDTTIVLGLVGRLAWQKNHAFFLEVVRRMLDRGQSVVGVFVGDGLLREEIENRVRSMKLEENIRFAGIRRDIPALMLNLFDMLMIPSFYEGGPIVAWEALAVGLPILMADCIETDLDRYFPNRIYQCSLNAPLDDWVETIDRFIAQRIPAEKALEVFETSPFTLRHSLNRLIELYETSPR